MKDSTIDLFLFYFPKHGPEDTRFDFGLLNLMIASARQAGVAGEIYFYTHESASIPSDLPVTRVVRIAPPNISPNDIQLIRAYAMHDFVNSKWFKRPTMAVESDELFERNPASAFDLPFDVGLTYACWTKKPHGNFGKLNGGVVYLNYRNPDAVRSYYTAYVDKFLEIKEEIDNRFSKPCRMAEWGGDEVTHLRLLPSTAFEGREQCRKTFFVSDASVMLLESIRFNCQYAEKTSNGLCLPTYPETLVRHFNAWRKPYMADYAERNLGLRMIKTSETSWGWKAVPAENSEFSRTALP